jgi:hypothetical protein
MRFSIDQALPGDIDAVLAALLDPEFLRCLGDLPNLAPPTVLARSAPATSSSSASTTPSPAPSRPR